MIVAGQTVTSVTPRAESRAHAAESYDVLPPQLQEPSHSTFFFHLRDHSSSVLDPDGTELPDLEAAINMALVAARDTLSHDIRQGLLDLRFRIEVEDAEGNLLHSLALKQAFTVVEE